MIDAYPYTAARNTFVDTQGGRRPPGTPAKVLRELRERWGVAASCIGVGRALVVVLEHVSGEVSQG